MNCFMLEQISCLRKIWFLRRVKMLLANLIAGFLNQLYLQNKMMKKLDFLHVDKNSLKLKVDSKILGCAWSKMDVSTLVTGL